MQWLRKWRGISIPLGKHQVLGLSVGFYTAWPDKNGTNYWCLEMYIAFRGLERCKTIKLDFWNPRTNGPHGDNG